jgi:hypothetical protein
MALTIDNTKVFLKSTNYIGIIVLISALVLVRGLGLVQIAKRAEAKVIDKTKSD